MAEGDADESVLTVGASKNASGPKQLRDQDDLINYLNSLNDDGHGVDYIVRENENPWTIATDRLGPNATDAERDRYARAILKRNSLSLEDATSILPGTELNLPSRPGTIIFIGGAGEGEFNNFVRDYERDARRNQDFPYETAYFQEQQLDGVIAYMNEVAGNGPIIIVAHSWGTTTAIDAAAGYDGIVAGIVAIDPVAKPGRADSLVRPSNVSQVVRVDGIGFGGRNDRIEDIGLALGGGPGVVYTQDADVTLTMRADHGDFRRMFETRVSRPQVSQVVSGRDLVFGIMRNVGTPIFNAQQRLLEEQH